MGYGEFWKVKHDCGKDGDSADAGHGPRIICSKGDLMHEEAQSKGKTHDRKDAGQALDTHAQSELRPIRRGPTHHSL